MALIAAMHAIGGDVFEALIAVSPAGAVDVTLRTRTATEAVSLALLLGGEGVEPGWATDGRSRWRSTDIGEYGDPIVLHVTGGHEPVCRCHPQVSA